MRQTRCLVGMSLVGSLLFLCGCGAGGGLVVIPPEIEKGVVPEGKYQGVHAVYLYNVGHVHFDPIDVGSIYYPTYAFTQYAKIKLLTRAATEGYHYGNRTVRHMRELLDLGAAVIKKDGTRQELTKSDFITNILVKDVVEDAVPPIHYYETVMVFPGLEPGDTIEYHYTKRGAAPFWEFTQPDAPVLYSKFMMARPIQRTEIQPLIFDRHRLNPEHLVEKGMATGMAGYTSVSRQATYDVWVARDVPPLISEDGMPPLGDVSSGVYVWQGEKRWDWPTMGKTYYKWFTHYGRYPSKSKELADQVVQGISDPKDKAKAIYNWVKQNLNIVPLDQLSYVPREIDITTIKIKKVLEEKTATSEQAASIMWLMLQSQGIEASLVLTTDDQSPEAEEGLPDLYQFNTPLLVLSDGTMLDTTNRLCSYGLAPWNFEGRKALWVKGDSVSFKNLPVSSPSDNRRDIAVNAVLKPDGGIDVQAKYTIYGQMAFAYRRWLVSVSTKEREQTIRDLASSVTDKAEVDNFDIIGLDEVDKPLGLLVNYHVSLYAQTLKDKMVFSAGAFINHVACPVLRGGPWGATQICPKPVSESRKNPVRFPFKWLDDVTVNLAFPPGFFLQALPKGFRTKEIDKGTVVGVQTSYGSNEGKSLNVIRKYSVNEVRVTPEAYPNLRELIRRYLGQKETVITLELPKM